MARGDNSSVIERDLTGYLLFQRHVGAAHAFEPQSMVLVGRVNSTGIELSFGNGWGERLESVWISAGSTDTRLGTVDSKAFVHEYVPETGSPVTVTVNSSVGGMERTVQRNSFVLARTRAEIEDSVWAGTILG